MKETSINSVKKICYTFSKRKKIPQIPYTMHKINFIWIKELRTKIPKTKPSVEENINE